MYQEINAKISRYSSIVIFRHQRPDMDALGSQIGLKHLILDNYQDKQVYIVGDMNEKYNFLESMDTIDDDIIKNSLAIIVDVAVVSMISDDRYNLAKEVIVIDHHNNDCDVANATHYKNIKAAAACQMIVELAMANNLKITEKCATALYSGMVTDSGRFLFSLTPELFECASLLVKQGARTSYIYEKLYSENLKDKKMKAYFTTKFKTNGKGVAYLFNKQSEIDKFQVDVATISRGMVGVMANIEGIEIWANFTYDKSVNKVLGEFRSKKIEILPIAKKYDGGGHALACGATLDNFKVAKQVINDFTKLLQGE